MVSIAELLSCVKLRHLMAQLLFWAHLYCDLFTPFL
jgi:hypothetical protein